MMGRSGKYRIARLWVQNTKRKALKLIEFQHLFLFPVGILLDNFAFSFIYLFYFVDTDFHQKD